MVKFGGHVEALREGDNKGTELYLVPYNEIKGVVFEDDAIVTFPKRWEKALILAEECFSNARKKLWGNLFATIASRTEEVRGLHPGNALKLFVDNVHLTKAEELLTRMTHILTAATTNSESLRKLVKKFDKNLNLQLSLELLPSLYTSSLYAGQNMMQDGVRLLRELLEGDASDTMFNPMIRHDSEARHQQAVEVRFEELDWLRRLVANLPINMLPHLVAHRGFHHIKDRNDKRPLENSQCAYEMAWSSGVNLCECDIAITKDGKLVLAHDENFMRLALDTNSHLAVRSIGELTLRELISLPLKSGTRPPLLIDVLRSACAISDSSKLVIEVKPGNQSAASALSRLLIRHPDLRQAVAMIMSFDVHTMHRLRAELSVLDESSTSGMAQNGSHASGMHHRITSFDHFGSLGSKMNLVDQASTDALPDLSPEKNHSNQRITIPKLMLLTKADPPERPCDLQVGVHDLSRVDNWLTTDDGTLDGVYLQFEKAMTTPEGAAALRQLSEKHVVGIWQNSGKDPDDYNTFAWLVQEGNVTFVNTDLPNQFKREVFVRKQTGLESSYEVPIQF